MSIEYTTDFDPEKNNVELKKQILQIVQDELSVAVEDLKRNSPVGVTQELKNTWELTTATVNSGEFICSILNNSSKPLNRLEGRKPGRQPPSSALEEWVSKKLKVSGKRLKSVAFLVARKIGREGTQRSKETPKQFDPATGQPVKNSAIDRALTRIEKKLDTIK